MFVIFFRKICFDLTIYIYGRVNMGVDKTKICIERVKYGTEDVMAIKYLNYF